jgi:DNA-binding transcriptional ArsR family regulator
MENTPILDEQPEAQTALLLSYLKTLADLSRLRILGALASQERTVEELADMLDLKAPTVSHHLARLRALGLVETRADGVTRWNRLEVAGLERLAKMLATPQMVATLAADVEGATWERKTLRAFLDGERLKEIPAQLKKRQVVLRWLANQFEWEREYSEVEVNEILKRRHPDSATLRRELIGEQLLARDHGRYWRTEPLTDAALDQIERRLEWGRIYTERELAAFLRQQTHSADSARRALLARGALTFDRDRYWLSRPPEERLK